MHYRNHIHRAVDWTGGAEAVAKKLGVTRATIYDWIKRGYVPKLDKAKALAKLANFQIRLIYFANEPRNPYHSERGLRQLAGLPVTQ
jgi:DNA-binding XRE family transcriptional regulator